MGNTSDRVLRMFDMFHYPGDRQQDTREGCPYISCRTTLAACIRECLTCLLRFCYNPGALVRRTVGIFCRSARVKGQIIRGGMKLTCPIMPLHRSACARNKSAACTIAALNHSLKHK